MLVNAHDPGGTASMAHMEWLITLCPTSIASTEIKWRPLIDLHSFVMLCHSHSTYNNAGICMMLMTGMWLNRCYIVKIYVCIYPRCTWTYTAGYNGNLYAENMV